MSTYNGEILKGKKRRTKQTTVVTEKLSKINANEKPKITITTLKRQIQVHIFYYSLTTPNINKHNTFTIYKII